MNDKEILKYQSFTYQQLLQEEKELLKEIEINKKSSNILEHKNRRIDEEQKSELNEVTATIQNIKTNIEKKIRAKIGRRPNNEGIYFFVSFVGAVVGGTFLMAIFPLGMFVLVISFFLILGFSFHYSKKLSERQLKEYDEKHYPLYELYWRESKKQNSEIFRKNTELENRTGEDKGKISNYYSRYLVIKKILKALPKLKRRAKQRERTAKIAAFDERARSGAQIVKGDLIKFLEKKEWICPYCNEDKDLKNSVAEHIHPIKKGGLSTPQNMVLICKTCNSNKRDLTLRVFCNKMKYSFEEICGRLEKLGKDV